MPTMNLSVPTPLRLRSDVTFTWQDDVLRMVSPVGAFALRGVADAVVDVLRALARTPADLPSATAHLSASEARQLDQILDRAYRLVAHCIAAGDRVVATVEATARDGDYEPVPVPPEAVLRLSKFALLRSHAGALVLESPVVKHRVNLVDPAAAAVVSALGSPRVAGDLDGLPAAVLAALLGHLVGAGFVEVGQGDGAAVVFGSDTEPTLRQWDFHDLVLHSRSRSGRFDQPFGGIFPYRGEIEPQPAVKPVPAGPAIELYRPSLDDVQAGDPSFTTVLEGRTSVRQYGAEPMSAEQLGEFLYRTARVRAVYGPGGGVPYEATTRPYPCGGAAYELELYLTVQRCAGVEPGGYYYDPVGHRLVLVNRKPAEQRAMLHTASVATGLQADPDVLVTMTSRFQRLSWKYRAIAYAVSLKHAGVLYQTMYLVATAMGLAPCGLGSGDADLAARTFGLDYLRESSVGDFILGSRPDTPPYARAVPPAWRPVNNPEWALAAQAALRGSAAGEGI